MDFEERRDNQPSQPPSETSADFRALVENLAHPVVIMDRAGKIRFMNPRAERMLAQGLKERVEAHLGSLPQRQPVSQVRFPVEGVGDLILRIRLSDIQWQGQPATQVALTDVTPYVTTAQRLSQEIAEFKEREGGLQDWRKKLEAQVRSLVAERDKVYASRSRRVAQETARLQKSRDEAQAQRDQLEAQLKELATEKERIEQSLRAELAQLRQAEPKAESANEELVQARRTIEELTSARRELEVRAGQGAAEFRQLQDAASQAESRLAAAEEQSRAEAEKASAERRQAQNEAQQLRGQIAEVERAMAESVERNRRLDEQVNQLVAAHENATRQLQAESVRSAEAEKTAAQLQAQLAEGDQAKTENERLQQRIAESQAMLAQRDAEHGQVQAEVKELTAAEAQLKAELDQERTERKKASEEAARLQQEISKSAQARNEIETQRAQLLERVNELAAAQAQSKMQYDAEIAERKKALDEIARLRQEISQAAELEKARADLPHETASRLPTQEEDQRPRRSLPEAVDTAETLKAGHEVLEEQAKKRADELPGANQALQQEFKWPFLG